MFERRTWIAPFTEAVAFQHMVIVPKVRLPESFQVVLRTYGTYLGG